MSTSNYFKIKNGVTVPVIESDTSTSLVLSPAGTTALTLDTSQNAIFKGTMVNITPTTGTNRAISSFTNTNNPTSAAVGLEGSVGGTSFTASTAYAMVMGTSDNNPIQFFSHNALAMTLDTSQNVGIGQVPTYGGRLEITGTSAAAYISSYITNLSSTGFTSLNMQVGTAGAQGQASIAYAPGTFFRVGPTANDTTTPLIFVNKNNTTALTIDTSQNVFLGGTADPFSRGYTKNLSVTSSGSTGIQVNGAASSNAEMDVGINGTRVASFAAVFGTPVTAQIGTNGSYAFNVITNNTTALTVDTSQNVGIGATPSHKLHIAESNISTSGTLFVQNTDATSSSDSLAAVTITKGSTTNTAGTNRFMQFNINAGGTGSGYIASNGANNVAFSASSDARLKDNVIDLPPQLANIMAIRPVEFDYKDGSGHQIGFIAQEMQTVYPDVVSADPEGMLSICGMSKSEARLIKAIQELAQEVKDLKAKLQG